MYNVTPKPGRPFEGYVGTTTDPWDARLGIFVEFGDNKGALWYEIDDLIRLREDWHQHFLQAERRVANRQRGGG
jgi:hypothetical protein